MSSEVLSGHSGGLGDIDLGMIAGDEHVNGWDDKEGKNGTNGHASHKHQTYGIPGFGTGSCYQHQREVAGDGGATGHEDGSQSRQRRLADGFQLGFPSQLQFVGNSTIRIPFFETTATNVTSPTWE